MNFTILHREVPNWDTHVLRNQNVVHDEYRVEMGFRELYDYMAANVETLKDKDNGIFFIPCDFVDPDDVESYDGAYKINYDTGEMTAKMREDGRIHVQRAYTNIATVAFLVIDYDGGVTIEDAIEHWLGLEVEFFVYTSFNHMIDKDNGEGLVDRFRIVVRIAEPISIDDYYNREESLIELAGGNCDLSTFTRGRGFYWPCKNKENDSEFFMHYFDDYSGSVDVIELSENKIANKAVSGDKNTKYNSQGFGMSGLGANGMSVEEMQEIKDELYNCSFPSYNDWFQMVEAMATGGFSEFDMNEVTLNNINHATTTSGTPDAIRCRTHWVRFAARGYSDMAIGKLVTWVRKFGNPDFRTKGYKSNLKIKKLSDDIDAIEQLIAKRKKSA